MKEPKGKKPTGSAWRKWPTKAEVQRDYHVSAAQLGALRRHGKLTKYLPSDGSERYDPAELDRIFRVTGGELDDDDDDDDDRELAGGRRSSSSNPDPLLQALEQSNHQLLELVRELRNERKELLDCFFKDPMNQVLAYMQEDRRQTREELGQLRTGYADALKATQAMLSEQHERELLTSYVQGEQERSDRRMELFKEYGGKLLDRVGVTVGLNAQAKAVVDFLGGLDSEIYTVLLGVLSPAQRATLENLRGASKNGAGTVNPPNGAGDNPPPNTEPS